MDCADEVEAVNRVLKPLPGVTDVEVNLMAGTVAVAHTSVVSVETLVSTLGRAGLRATLATASAAATSPADAQQARLISVIVSGGFTGLGLALQWLKVEPEWLRLGSFAIAIVAGGWFIAP